MPFSRRVLAYALGIIFCANFLNYVDRQLVSALEIPISRDFHLEESEFGLLWTLFTIGYMLCAPLIGFLTDRIQRPRLFAVCILIWSLATLASGFASSKGVLYLSRIFIGVGEAGCLIIGPTLVSDYFSQEVRGRALSIFYLGMPMGGTAGYIIGGFFERYFDWRQAFYCAGIPGIFLAFGVWTLVDPPHGSVDAKPTKGIRPYLALLRTRTLLWIILAQAFAVMTLVPLLHYGKRFFQEARGMGALEAATTLGTMALIAGGLGNILSGIIGDRLAKRTQGAYALLAGTAFLAGMPCFLIGFSIASPWIYLPFLTLACFFYFLCMPAVNTQIANVTHPRQRAMAWALAVFILHLLGDTLAPWAFGEVSEHVGRQRAFLYFSGAMILAGLCCFLAARSAAEDSRRASEAQI